MQGSPSQRLGFLFAAGGIGLCAYAAVQWYQLPRYSEDDLKASTELNLQLDLARSGQSTPSDPQRMDQLRLQVRTEIQQEIQKQQRLPLNWLVAGVAFVIVGALRLWTQRFGRSF